MGLQRNTIYAVRVKTVPGEKSFWSSAKPKNRRSFDINKRIIYAMRRIGVGLSGIKTFLN